MGPTVPFLVKYDTLIRAKKYFEHLLLKKLLRKKVVAVTHQGKIVSKI